MADYTRRLAEIEEVCRQASAASLLAARELGSKLASLPPDTIPTDASDAMEDFRRLTTLITARSDEIQRLLEIDSNQQAIRARMAELQDERDGLRAGLGPVYEAIGEAGFRVFREKPVADPGYAQVFERLAEHHDSLRSLEHQLEAETRQRESTGVIRRVLSGGRRLTLSRRLRATAAQAPLLYEDAGRKLAAGRFVDRVDDERFRSAFEPLREVEQRITDIGSDIDALTIESGDLLDAFNTLSSGDRLAAARASRERDIETARGELNHTLQALGEIAERVALPELEAETQRLAAARKRDGHFTEIHSRLEAGRSAEAAQRRAEEIEGRVRHVQHRISELQKEKKNLQANLRSTEAERDRLLSIRGGETDLFSG